MRSRARRSGPRLATGIFLLLLTLAGAPDGQAQSLPPALAAAIAATATATNTTRLQAVVVELIATHPSLAETILHDAIARRPQDAAAILGHTQAAFPAFAGRLAAAARQPMVLSVAPAMPSQTSATFAMAPTWSGEIDLGASRVTGNTESTEVNFKTKIDYESTKWRNEGRFEFDFADDDDVTDERSFLFSIETDYKLTSRFYLLGFASYEDDAFSGFDFRITEPAGVGYGLVRLAHLDFDVEAGIGARQTRIEGLNDTENETVGRFDAEFAWQISDHAKVGDQTTIFLGEERTTFESTVTLTSTIIDRFAVRLSFNAEHETKVEQGTEKTDTTSKVSLVYSF